MKPLWQGGVFLLDLYSQAILERNLAAFITPEPRVRDERATLAGVEMRVTWWRPGWGDRHAAVLLVNGAVEEGNDEPFLRRTAAALARAGYLVMLPEFPSLRALRIDPALPGQVAAALAHLRARPDAYGDRTGVFGLSIGAQAALVAAGTEPAFHELRYVACLSPIFSVDAFVASHVTQTLRVDGEIAPFQGRTDVRLKLQQGVARLAGDPDAQRLVDALERAQGDLRESPPADIGAEARALWELFLARDRAEAERRLRELPTRLRATMDAVDPRRVWASVTAPVYLIHSPTDDVEPVTESYAAASAPREGTTRLLVPGLLHHWEILSERARREGALYFVREIASMLAFARELLARAG